MQNLGVVHQTALFLGGGRDGDAEQHISRFGTGEDMAHRTDAADPRHDARHFRERTAFHKFFEAAKFGDMKLRRLHLARIVEVNGDFGMTLDSGHGLNDQPVVHNACAHDPNFLPSTAGVRPARRSVTKLENGIRRWRATGQKIIHRHGIVDAQHAIEQARDDQIAGGHPRDDIAFAISAIEHVLKGKKIAERGDVAGNGAVAETQSGCRV